MRQVGILAAAGLYALEHNRISLAEDHRRARLLAETLHSLEPFSIDPKEVETNIVMFDVVDGRTAEEILSLLRDNGVLMVPFGPRTIRATLHRDIDDSQLDRSRNVLAELFN